MASVVVPTRPRSSSTSSARSNNKPSSRQAPRNAGIKDTNEKRQVVGQYMLGKTIGEGTFGKVKLAVHMPSGEKVAVKILEKSRIKEAADVRRVNREIKILKKARHSNIIQLYEVLDTSHAIYLIMECAEGGEMFDFIVSQKHVPELQACKFFHQIIDGLEMLHNNEITHRDLKPENLLLKASPDGWVIKIVDFGLSNTHEGGRLLATACGSPCYAAPEMIAGKKYFGPLADLWSVGVILFALVCGYLPFEDNNTAILYKKILSGEYKPAKWLSCDVRDLIRKILEVDPNKRFTINDIRKHIWYNQITEQDIPHEVTYSINEEHQAKEEVIQSMAKNGMDITALLDALASHTCNSLTAMYYLLQQKYRSHRLKIQQQGGQGQSNGAQSGPSTVNTGVQIMKPTPPTTANTTATTIPTTTTTATTAVNPTGLQPIAPLQQPPSSLLPPTARKPTNNNNNNPHNLPNTLLPLPTISTTINNTNGNGNGIATTTTNTTNTHNVLLEQHVKPSPLFIPNHTNHTHTTQQQQQQQQQQPVIAQSLAMAMNNLQVNNNSNTNSNTSHTGNTPTNAITTNGNNINNNNNKMVIPLLPLKNKLVPPLAMPQKSLFEPVNNTTNNTNTNATNTNPIIFTSQTARAPPSSSSTNTTPTHANNNNNNTTHNNTNTIHTARPILTTITTITTTATVVANGTVVAKETETTTAAVPMEEGEGQGEGEGEGRPNTRRRSRIRSSHTTPTNNENNDINEGVVVDGGGAVHNPMLPNGPVITVRAPDSASSSAGGRRGRHLIPSSHTTNGNPATTITTGNSIPVSKEGGEEGTGTAANTPPSSTGMPTTNTNNNNIPVRPVPPTGTRPVVSSLTIPTTGNGNGNGNGMESGGTTPTNVKSVIQTARQEANRNRVLAQQGSLRV